MKETLKKPQPFELLKNLGKALNRYFEYVIELNAPNKKEKHWGC